VLGASCRPTPRQMKQQNQNPVPQIEGLASRLIASPQHHPERPPVGHWSRSTLKSRPSNTPRPSRIHRCCRSKGLFAVPLDPGPWSSRRWPRPPAEAPTRSASRRLGPSLRHRWRPISDVTGGTPRNLGPEPKQVVRCTKLLLLKALESASRLCQSSLQGIKLSHLTIDKPLNYLAHLCSPKDMGLFVSESYVSRITKVLGSRNVSGFQQEASCG